MFDAVQDFLCRTFFKKGIGCRMEKVGCMACPRRCGADRTISAGYCGMKDGIKIARIGLHLWEEPCISYGKGSGTIFFSGCNLRCVFCQNYEISQNEKGKEITRDRLIQEIFHLEEQGASNINLVTPSHYTDKLADVLAEIKGKLKIPVIYNSSGYDSVSSLKKLDGLVDCYLPDLKYYSGEMSKKYSGAADYFETATEAIAEMFRQCGYYREDENGHMVGGVLIRHMVLPGGYRDSMKILDWIAENYDTERMGISLMSQYFPTHQVEKFPELNRKITTFEYKKVVEYAQNLGFCYGFIQERSSATQAYVPDFDYE